ncbi:ABC transporter B family member 22 [Morus notabilis]|uniref:ABC transporter B family member 22 n=1 Tax=Morus notabilis TaxID=981085 RepID=W9RBI3_9ROSA|nr:ABC transporter B family member 22 [Morus notabilis]
MGPYAPFFMQADGVDMLLMFFGFIGAVLDGFTDRLPLYFTSHMINSIGNASKLDPDVLRQSLISHFFGWMQNAVGILYGAGVSLVACFLEGYCWTRTGERQAARMRIKYLKAILRQDLSYFDLYTSNTAEVITTISNDSLIIQDAISEKVPNFVSQVSTFIGGLIVAFIVSWELALVALPFVLLLVIPGWMCGRSLLNLAGKIRSEYNKAGTVAEMAISSIRTVHAFGGEKTTVAKFSTALNGATKLVMYHGAQGGTVFAAGTSIVHGGLALGAGLSNIKDIVEAQCAGKSILEVITRVPKIDVENMEGMILEEISSKVEFKQVNFQVTFSIKAY